MTDRHLAADTDTGTIRPDPGDRVTGSAPMTVAQRASLNTLSEAARVATDDALASRRIDDLQRRAGHAPRGGSSVTDAADPPESALGEEDPGAGLDAPGGNDPARRSTERADGLAPAAIDRPRGNGGQP